MDFKAHPHERIPPDAASGLTCPMEAPLEAPEKRPSVINATEEPTGVTFIYINGSNNLTYKNREKFRIAFLEDVKKENCRIMPRATIIKNTKDGK